MENNFTPRPWKYLLLLVIASGSAILYSLWPGNAKADIAAVMFFGGCYLMGFIGFVAESVRVTQDGRARVLEAVASANVTLTGMSDDKLKALSNLMPELELRRNQGEWLQLFHGVDIAAWLEFWNGCDLVGVRPQHSYPDGTKRDARNTIVRYLLARGYVSPAIGNKSETWKGNGYAVVKTWMQSYQYKFERIREL